MLKNILIAVDSLVASIALLRYREIIAFYLSKFDPLGFVRNKDIWEI